MASLSNQTVVNASHCFLWLNFVQRKLMREFNGFGRRLVKSQLALAGFKK
jgi:hypothetical protein